ncbi:uncharacterized protein A4U43_C03F26240 [Asparagus officinalis]|uniref:Uncharacterized protein n=1 Tax=Asparagus officinalis TaxID=4686 RepID=A0A5P1FD60_ASPOF|nr:uncharacterized protein A4U43_C03F26240 [Asparagus officinalis]
MIIRYLMLGKLPPNGLGQVEIGTPAHSPRCKEPVPLDQEDLDDEEKVDYEAYTNTYLAEPNDVGFEGDVGSSPYMLADELGWKLGVKQLLYLSLLVTNLNQRLISAMILVLLILSILLI